MAEQPPTGVLSSLGIDVKDGNKVKLASTIALVAVAYIKTRGFRGEEEGAIVAESSMTEVEREQLIRTTASYMVLSRLSTCSVRYEPATHTSNVHLVGRTRNKRTWWRPLLLL